MTVGSLNFAIPSVDDELGTLVPADFTSALFTFCLRFSVN